jgi:hypothetical protein
LGLGLFLVVIENLHIWERLYEVEVESRPTSKPM